LYIKSGAWKKFQPRILILLILTKNLKNYFFLDVLVCDKALAATDLEILLDLPSRNILLALLATLLDVSFLFTIYNFSPFF